MRHRISGKKLSRDGEHRKALKRNLAASLFIHGRIRTTEPRAKFVRSFVEKLITIAKKGDLNARRRVIALLQDRFIVDEEETDVKRNKSYKVVKGPRLIRKLFSEIAPKYADRSGGYTRIVKLPQRRLGDGSALVYLELIDPEEEKPKRKVDSSISRRKKAQSRIQLMNKLIKKTGKAPKSVSADNSEQEQKQNVEAEKAEQVEQAESQSAAMAESQENQSQTSSAEAGQEDKKEE